MSPKEIVKAFYESDLANDISLISKYIHQDCILHWNSSKGYSVFNFNEIKELFEDIIKSYVTIRFQISHMLEDNEFVTTRYTLFVKAIENPDEEIPLAHFITIWELKDQKLFRGFEISQLADDSPKSLKSFNQIKV